MKWVWTTAAVGGKRDRGTAAALRPSSALDQVRLAPSTPGLNKAALLLCYASAVDSS